MGGIENFMAALIQQQVDNGDAVSAIVHHHEPKLSSRKEEFNGALIYRVKTLGNLAYTPISPSFIKWLSRIIDEVSPDVIHIHMPNLSAFWLLILAKAKNTPWIIHWHADVIGSVPDLKIKLLYPFYRILEKALLKKASQIITTSLVYLTSSNPLRNFVHKTTNIPLGLGNNTVTVENSDFKFIELSDNLKLLMIGRLTYYKGHNIVLNALARLNEKESNFSLSIIGSGELFDNISKKIVNLDLADDVKLLGKLSDKELAIQLAETDLLCLASIERTEAFGVVLLEAMRASKPCLVTDVPGSGMSWVVQDNKTGFVVEHNCVDSLVAKLQYIAANKKLLSKYGNEGNRRFNKTFSIKAVSSNISDVYNQVINK